MVNMLEIRGIRVDHPTVRRILAENWQLRPAPPTYYQRYTITYNGETQRQDSKTARVYTVTRDNSADCWTMLRCKNVEKRK